MDDHASRNKQPIVVKEKTKNYYNAHNFATRLSFGMQVSVHDGNPWQYSQDLSGPLESFTAMKVKGSAWSMERQKCS